MIRSLKKEDFGKLKEIHEKYYAFEFDFPDFEHNFLSAFVVEEEGRIISAAGIRLVVESIAITDKSISVRKRRKALIEVLNASVYFANKFGHDQIHAFISDEGWEDQLKRYGFKETKGKGLIYG